MCLCFGLMIISNSEVKYTGYVISPEGLLADYNQNPLKTLSARKTWRAYRVQNLTRPCEKALTAAPLLWHFDPTLLILQANVSKWFAAIKTTSVICIRGTYRSELWCLLHVNSISMCLELVNAVVLQAIRDFLYKAAGTDTCSTVKNTAAAAVLWHQL